MGCRKSNYFVRLQFSSVSVTSLYPFGVARKWSSHGALPGHRILPNRSAKADAHPVCVGWHIRIGWQAQLRKTARRFWHDTAL